MIMETFSIHVKMLSGVSSPGAFERTGDIRKVTVILRPLCAGKTIELYAAKSSDTVRDLMKKISQAPGGAHPRKLFTIDSHNRSSSAREEGVVLTDDKRIRSD